MSFFKDYRRHKAKQKFLEEYNKSIQNGTFKKFDEEFYQQFEGKYFRGLPIYFYLREVNMGECYNTSSILALCLTLTNYNVYLCQGELEARTSILGGTFDHGWVEMGNKVYDTTWQIIADKDTYYRIFKVKCDRCYPTEEYFTYSPFDDLYIHNKAYYEENNRILDYPLVEEYRKIVEENLKELKKDDPSYEIRKKFLEDLPKATLQTTKQRQSKLNIPDNNGADSEISDASL